MADTCANPLLLGWIKEWLDQARERNSKGFTVFVPNPSPGFYAMDFCID